MTYMKGGCLMKMNTRVFPPGNRAVANSRQEAAVPQDQKLSPQDLEKLNSLPPQDRTLVERVLANHPGLTIDEALAMLKEAGGL